jgi:hypothetical protein
MDSLELLFITPLHRQRQHTLLPIQASAEAALHTLVIVNHHAAEGLQLRWSAENQVPHCKAVHQLSVLILTAGGGL